MTGSWILVIAIARAHGGEDHGSAPSPGPSLVSEGACSVVSSQLLDGVLSVPPTVGTPVQASLLLADHVTSAPIEGATATLSLAGPGSARATFGEAGRAGAFHGTLTLPAAGTYAGALVVTVPAHDGATEGMTDLLSVPSLRVDPAIHGAEGGAPPSATPPPGTAVPPARALLALVLASGLGLGVGWFLGRRRGAGAAGGLLFAGTLALTGREVEAHGGESHGDAPASAHLAAGSTLTLAMERQFLVGLRTARVVRAAFEDHVPALGRFVARPGEAATVGAPVDGVVRPPSGGGRFPTPGTQVRAGHVLAILEETQGGADRAALAEARETAATGVARAQAALVLAERDVAALERLGESVSERERIARLGARDVARTDLAEAEARRAALGEGRGVEVIAPVSGRLGPVRVRPGDRVQAGDPLFRIVDARGAWVEVRVPEGDALGVLPGARARVVTTAGTTEAGGDARTLRAKVLDAGQEVDPATGQVTMTLVLDDPTAPATHDTPARHDVGEALRRGFPPPPPTYAPADDVPAALRVLPGMSAMVWLGRGGSHPAIVVPVGAIVDSEGVSLAFVKTGPETFETRVVQVGGRDGADVEVRSGLGEGERVVVEGAGTLRILAGR